MVFLRSLGTGLVAGAILGSLQTVPAAASPNPASHRAARSSARKPPASADPYLWLEDVTGKRIVTRSVSIGMVVGSRRQGAAEGRPTDARRAPKGSARGVHQTSVV